MKLIRLPDVMARVRLGRSTIYKLIAAQKFPAPVKQGGASFWFDDQIDAYLTALRASQTTAASS